ncbi:MAG: superoxide dismutase [Bacillota bacterium]|nr:superoxide dismutase [Bacillota bacterium]
MTFRLEALAYPYDALEPTIDARTMEVHHSKHHQAYVNNLNAALEGVELEVDDVAALLRNLEQLPESRRTAVRNHGGGHYNHELFWESMTPGGAATPTGRLAAAIEADFGSLEALQAAFNEAGAKQFGSGWAWLVLDNGRLAVESSANQDNPISRGRTPLLGNDVWEHAYYLKYQNRRGDYLQDWWQVVNWDVVARRYEAAVSGPQELSS